MKVRVWERRSSRVLRGLSWINDARYCRIAFRINNDPNKHFYDLGFRLVRRFR